jgi:hypothetical protein
VVQELGQLVGLQMRETRKLPQLRDRLDRWGEAGEVDRVRQQAVEQPLVDLEDLGLFQRPDGGGARRSLGQSQLAEGLSPAQGSQGPLRAGRGILLDDPQPSRSNQVEGLRTLALADHRLPGGERSQPDSPGELVQDIHRKVVEQGECVDELRRFHPPSSLQPETRASPQCTEATDRRADQLDGCADHGAADEEGQKQ